MIQASSSFSSIVAVLGAAVAIGAPETEQSTNVELCRFVRDRDQSLTKITTSPVRIRSAFSALCVGPPADSVAVEPSPHGDRWIDVFVTNSGVASLRSGQKSYPKGVVILKEKRKDDSGDAASELFTGMLKREKGYNPDCGDWEFFVVNGDANRMLARGRIDSCIECHKAYSGSDFVVRDYLKSKDDSER